MLDATIFTILIVFLLFIEKTKLDFEKDEVMQYAFLPKSRNLWMF